MIGSGARRWESGQTTVEWAALLLVVAVALAALVAAAGLRPPGTALAESIAERLICAVRLSDGCRSDPELYAAYGGELAELVRRHAPAILYEDGMTAMPVDFRRCRNDPCAEGPATGLAIRSLTGRPAVAFTRVIDCREPAAAPGADCSGGRAGRIYIQYWLYYTGSATAEGRLLKRQMREWSARAGRPSFHRDDWESFQVRINPDGSVDARASSHHGHNGRGGIGNWGSDLGSSRLAKATELAGVRDPNGWRPSRGTLYVSGGSHAGHVDEHSARRAAALSLAEAILQGRRLTLAASRPAAPGRRAQPSPVHPAFRVSPEQRRRRLARRLERSLFGPGSRRTPRRALQLIPIEPLAGSGRRTGFAVVPPWRKRVYRDPEHTGTD